VKEIKENLMKNNFNYKQLLSPRLKQKIEALSLKENNIERIFEQIEEKKKEKMDYFEKVEKLQNKLSTTKNEEYHKKNVIDNEFSEIKEISQSLSIEIENIHVENYKHKMNFEKMKEEISNNTALVAQDIQKLDKKSKK
jgi:chromosome segregation ATPase